MIWLCRDRNYCKLFTMKILLVSLVAVLFVSGKFAFDVDLKDDVSEESNGNVNIKYPTIEMDQNDYIRFGKFEVEPIKRSKKSYYTEPPCSLCGYNGNQFAPRPSMGYQPSTGGNYFHSKPYAPSPVYSGPTYNGPPKPYQHQHASVPVPQYSAPVPSYTQPPAYNSYNKYPAPVYQGPSNYYPQPSHTMPTSLLVGCHPHVSTITNGGYFPHYASSPYSPPHYASSPHSPPPQHYPTTYRSNSQEVSATSNNFDYNQSADYINEKMPEKMSLLDNSSSAESSVNNENNETNQSAKKIEKPKQQQPDTLWKMAQIQNKLTNKQPTTEEKQRQTTTNTDQGKKT